MARRFQEMELEQLRKGEMSARKKLEKAQGWVENARADLERRLERVRKSGAAAGDELREGAESAWTDLEAAVDRARREFAGENTDQADEDDPDGR